MKSNRNGSGAHACHAMMREALLHALQQQVALDGCIKSKRQAIADQLANKALAGDMRAIKEVFEWTAKRGWPRSCASNRWKPASN